MTVLKGIGVALLCLGLLALLGFGFIVALDADSAQQDAVRKKHIKEFGQ